LLRWNNYLEGKVNVKSNAKNWYVKEENTEEKLKGQKQKYKIGLKK